MSDTSISVVQDHWDKDLISKYDIAGPRYTSYPTAPQFSPKFDSSVYISEFGEAFRNSKQSNEPLSLYIHIPFCQNICYYCACNKVVTSDRGVVKKYLEHLYREIDIQSSLAGNSRSVMQLHLGGGTPTFMDSTELAELIEYLGRHFKLSNSDQREYSIEIDPRTVTNESLQQIKNLGFNRLSFGVQDFDDQVQRAINRIQTYEMIQSLSEAARKLQFKSLSFDLIYGLPLQTLETLSHTLKKVIRINPDRIAFYNYAHLPERFKSQRAISRYVLPSAEQKIDMLMSISQTLISAGYIHIGMDHFVKPEDELAIAQSNGKLQRNFQGYSTCLATDLIGLGVSAISSLSNSYSQNEPVLEDYYRRLGNSELAVCKGMKLSFDDKLRRQVISNLICNLELDTDVIAHNFSIDFRDYFVDELMKLEAMESDGLVYWCDNTLLVSEVGRVVIRNICMVFDKYLSQKTNLRFSKSL